MRRRRTLKHLFREIKFRGKRLDNGEWVYGCLTRYSDAMSYITVDLIEGEVYEVCSATVGQFTGLQDKNDVEIYGGDVVKVRIKNEYFTAVVSYSKHRGCYVFGQKHPQICYYSLDDIIEDAKMRITSSYNIEGIGNIQDNPELLNEEVKVNDNDCPF